MADEAPNSYPSLRLTKTSTWIGYGFLLAVAFVLPCFDRTIGLPWWWVWGTLGTLGVTFVLAIIGSIGFFACQRRGERISVIYAICPALVVISVIFLLNCSDIVQAMLHYVGAT